jgi:hypothetical protein
MSEKYKCDTCREFEQRTKQKAKELQDKIEDIACDVQEGAKFTEGRVKRLSELNAELSALPVIQEGKRGSGSK